MSMNLVVLLYLLASVCFIQALKGLSHPKTSILGNAFGMSGMAIAVLTTLGLIFTLAQQMQVDAVQGLGWVLAGLVLGGGAGAVMAKRGRDDQDARAGRLHAQHDRPGRGVHRGSRPWSSPGR